MLNFKSQNIVILYKNEQYQNQMHMDYGTNDHMKDLHIQISPIIADHMYMA